jgi:hypothetical protein
LPHGLWRIVARDTVQLAQQQLAAGHRRRRSESWSKDDALRLKPLDGQARRAAQRAHGQEHTRGASAAPSRSMWLPEG